MGNESGILGTIGGVHSGEEKLAGGAAKVHEEGSTVVGVIENSLFDRPVSAALARRLAEAATGYQGNGTVWIVASHQPVPDRNDPYGVEVFADVLRAEARKIELDIEHRDLEWGVFGPFDTPAPVTTVTKSRRFSVQEFAVQVLDGSTEDVFPVAAGGFDSLFWTAAAVQKFAVPYYSYLYSPAFGQHVMERFLSADVALLGHKPWSEYTTFEPDGTEQPGQIPVLFRRTEHGEWIEEPLDPRKHA